MTTPNVARFSGIAMLFLLILSASCNSPQNSNLSKQEEDVNQEQTEEAVDSAALEANADTLTEEGLVTGPKMTTSFNCSGEKMDLFPLIQHYADSVTALNLTYDQSTANDCSGTFIRLNQFLNNFCPNDYFPSFEKARSSRDLVQYYQEKGNLVLINDPLSADSLIKPGAIMFYTKSNRGGDLNIVPDSLQKFVNHVGVVYEVTTNDDGVVEKYSLFHGRNPKRGIGITTFHDRNPFSNQNKPYPYGNGREQWMAVAPILVQ